MNLKPQLALLLSYVLLFVPGPELPAQNVLTAAELLSLKSVGLTDLSPDGTELIYNLSTPRGPNDAAGGAKSEYFRMTLADNSSEALFSVKSKGFAPLYSPDG